MQFCGGCPTTAGHYHFSKQQRILQKSTGATEAAAVIQRRYHLSQKQQQQEVHSQTRHLWYSLQRPTTFARHSEKHHETCREQYI